MKNIYNLIVCVAIIATSSIVLCGCGDDNDESLFLIKGNISNPTGNAVRDAEITLFSDTEVLKTATTDDSGNYEIPNVSSGIFNLSVQKDGYNNLTDIQVEVSGEDIVEDFLIEGNADIRGMVINSQTGRGLANALVRFTEGTTINATDTSFIDLSTTTDEFGNYEIEGAPIGSFLCIVYSEDFIPRVIENLSFEEGENDLDPNVLVESIGQGQIRIVLTWGALPEDLDTHLTGPQEGSDSRFHLYYANEAPNEDVFLDVDDVTSFGPETTTITTFYNGLYRYSVHNYDNQSISGGVEIFNSPTLVEVFDMNGLVQSFSPPPAKSTSGNTWRVFEMNVLGGNIDLTALNNYEQVIDEDNGNNFRSSKNKTRFKEGNF